MSSSMSREGEAFNAATAMVTCLMNGDHTEARRIACSNDVLHEDMLLILAGVVAVNYAPEEWQQAALRAAQMR
ncbi:hypothetical protein K378_01472 [Streptomyces sp. Amel2xB2]|uniref:hypothetical protein n=1 Tax=Streptomyces sp. Amel2xB2 TaxID=1305829 RepID=UPI000DB90E0C|nr:hypothetical protein [Streptomyces sp. Amel2xB2]RAJ70307.1 hypothetical protein K378_01472 [Streptomyces sp. Amel2xB2]